MRALSLRRWTAAVVLLLVMALAFIAGPHHRDIEQQAAQTTTATSVVSGTDGAVCADPEHRVVTVSGYVPLSVVGIYVPGTASTVPDPPAGPVNTEWLDWGVWEKIPDKIGIMDSDLYPATLERTGPKNGTKSVQMGANAVISEILKYKPGTMIFSGVGGSQGALVWSKVLIELKAMGYPMEDVFVTLYADPGMPDTGILSRFGPNQPVLSTGLFGGAPTLPSEAKVLRVVQDDDPMAFFVKRPFNLMADLNAIVGFMFKHGALGQPDYGHSTTTVEGNVTTVVLHDPDNIVALLEPLRLMNAPRQLVKFLNYLVRPLILAGGMYETGRIELNFTLEEVARQIRAVAQGGGDALAYLGRLIMHQPDPPERASNPVTEVPASGLIDEANQRDQELQQELNGSAPEGASQSTVERSAGTEETPESQTSESPTVAAEQVQSSTSSTAGGSEITSQEVMSESTTKVASSAEESTSGTTESKQSDEDSKPTQDTASEPSTKKDEDSTSSSTQKTRREDDDNDSSDSKKDAPSGSPSSGSASKSDSSPSSAGGDDK